MGRDWEKEFAVSVGGHCVPGSGAFFSKLDVRGASVLWSLKWSGNNASFRFEDKLVHEALSAIHAPGGVGGDVIPGFAFKTAGGEYITFRKADALLLMAGEASIATPGALGIVDTNKRLPSFLRDV
jgi:hypothetical protein